MGGEGWLTVKGTFIALVTSSFYYDMFNGKGWSQIFRLFKRAYFIY